MKNFTLINKANKTINVGSLRENLLKKEKRRALTRQQRFEDRQLQKIMNQLYHIANSTDKCLFSLPIKISFNTDQFGLGRYGASISLDKNVDILKGFQKIAKHIKPQGFITKVTCEKPYAGAKYYVTTLIVDVKV